MAKIVVPRNQQLAMAEEHPKPYYSRIVSVHLYMHTHGAEVYAVTPSLGNRIWLLGIRAWTTIQPVDLSQFLHFDLVQGSEKAVDVEQVKRWTRLVPIRNYFDGLEYWQIYDGSPGFEWSMMQFFEGSMIRFGAWGWRDGENPVRMQISFEISEG